MLLDIQNPIARRFFVVALQQQASFFAGRAYVKLNGRFTIAIGIFKNFGIAQGKGSLEVKKIGTV